ncbi:thioredoxin family protein [Leeuwenhoekiella sp. MAR_2009_132]|uniref:thioredoxin family protein n=1 Tax=Leeuwenhoekiella sp. MAR_2009_132 TaxID=1392489 RepID=UPI00048ABA95|nr:thioredoxin family protein [Leeuwenhoekiella sp. MAR_2009_132]
MKRFILLLIVCCGSLAAQDRAQINWISWEQLEDSLVEKPKKTFIFFHADWCAYCKKIDRVVFTKPEVIKKINKEFYALRMNVETTDTIHFDGQIFTNKQHLTKRNGVHELPLLQATRPNKPFSLPVTLIFNKDFTVEKRIFEYYTSGLLLGFLDD